MAENLETPKIIDNVNCRLGDDISAFLKEDACVYVASRGFSLSAFEHLADELESVKEFRFVFTAPAFVPQDAVKEALRAELADIEKKLSNEKQLNRKYELAKEKQRLQREIDYVVA